MDKIGSSISWMWQPLWGSSWKTFSIYLRKLSGMIATTAAYFEPEHTAGPRKVALTISGYFTQQFGSSWRNLLVGFFLFFHEGSYQGDHFQFLAKWHTHENRGNPHTSTWGIWRNQWKWQQEAKIFSWWNNQKWGSIVSCCCSIITWVPNPFCFVE